MLKAVNMEQVRATQCARQCPAGAPAWCVPECAGRFSSKNGSSPTNYA